MVALGLSVITILILVIVASEIGQRNAAALTSASTETHASQTAGNREEQAGVACLRAVAGQPPRWRAATLTPLLSNHLRPHLRPQQNPVAEVAALTALA